MLNGSPLGIKDLVKFPFLEDSIKFMMNRMKNIEMKNLNEREFPDLIKKVERRTLYSIRRGISPIFDDMYVDVYSELLSFFISMIVIKATEDPHIISRYSLAEARRAEILLKNELRGDATSIDLLGYIFKNVTSSNLIKSDTALSFKLHFTDYLRLTSHFQSPSWKLVNRALDSGYVYLKDREVIRLIREGIYRFLFKRIISFPTPILSSELKQLVEKLRKERPSIRVTKRLPTIRDFPPCIEMIMAKIDAGENISHFSRFFLVTYLLAAGWNIDKIIALFSKMPDFKESVARYQVEHIAGLRGGRKRYSVPNCKLIATYGLCVKDKNCENIKNPVRYRRKGNERRR